MKTLNYITLTIAIIGALNWGLIGLFGINLVSMLFGIDSMVSRIVYVLVGVSGLCIIGFYPKIYENHKM